MESKTSKGNILVVEDEATIRELLEAMLEPQNYAVRTAGDGQEGLRAFFSWKPDLVFLDVMMPKMDGWKLLERIREVSDVPVIMLTALGMEHEKVRGLKGGADDYLTKPVSQGELLARVEAVLRRNKKASFVESYRDSLLHLDFERHMVLKSGQEIDLSPTEFRLLTTLVKHKGTVMSVERLLDTCWEDGIGRPDNVRVYVSYLRRKLGSDVKGRDLIETVREFGYRYRPPRITPCCLPLPSCYRRFPKRRLKMLSHSAKQELSF